MPQQILDNLGIVPVLPEQRCVAVAKSVPALQWNAEVCSNRLDEREAALLDVQDYAALKTGKDVVTVSSVRRFLPPRKQLSN
jgi:hypothetical protein